MIDVTLKRCADCGIQKPLDMFYNMSSGKYGKDAWCKSCRKKRTTLYAKTMTPTQRQRRRKQTQEYYMRKYGVPYEPTSRRAERGVSGYTGLGREKSKTQAQI